MRVAIYARYSSDQQRDASIADQFRMCRLRAEKEGWQVVEEYSDHAISGSSMIQRPGLQALIMDSARGRFDMVLAEALDRVSRDQEDIAGIYKRMRYADVKMFTLSEGEISELHVGLKGTMNALFIKDLADKTRRGLRGRVEDGKSGGGNSYGYNVVKKFDASGEPIRGDRMINAVQAAVRRPGEPTSMPVTRAWAMRDARWPSRPPSSMARARSPAFCETAGSMPRASVLSQAAGSIMVFSPGRAGRMPSGKRR